jgi:hypothetical protein
MAGPMVGITPSNTASKSIMKKATKEPSTHLTLNLPYQIGLSPWTGSRNRGNLTTNKQ